MKKIVEDIRILLKDGAFKDEQHVRFSLVGRICQALGWNIWDPTEFYTEYPVKRYPPQEINSDLRGRVDVALILPEKNYDIAEVFIEVKTPYRLQKELVAGEIQLKRYNWWDKSAISVLTDGIIWRFYLPSIGGAFENSLFSEIDLSNDNIEAICNIFNQVLRRNNFRKQALESAESIYEEIAMIKKLNNVKHEAEDIAMKTGLSKYTLASQLLANQHNYQMEVTEIERLWEAKTPTVTKASDSADIPFVKSDSRPNNESNEPGAIDFKVLQDYNFKSARLVVIKGKQFPVRHWWEIKKHVYNYLIENHPAIASSRVPHLRAEKRDSMDITLSNGMYTRGRLSASNTIKQCRAAMKSMGYEPFNDMQIGYVDSQRARKA
ncbi:MAG: hypothetical protein PHO85_04325 [Candidatus Cloacimonetes bacterium]|nr:hypothetical protein [Candidatus Cloacimonadota bacterium]